MYSKYPGEWSTKGTKIFPSNTSTTITKGVNPMRLAQVVEALVLRFTPIKVQSSTPHGCKQFFGATPLGEKLAIYPVLYRKISEGAMHETRIYSERVGPKGSTFERFPE